MAMNYYKDTCSQDSNVIRERHLSVEPFYDSTTSNVISIILYEVNMVRMDYGLKGHAVFLLIK